MARTTAELRPQINGIRSQHSLSRWKRWVKNAVGETTVQKAGRVKYRTRESNIRLPRPWKSKNKLAGVISLSGDGTFKRKTHSIEGTQKNPQRACRDSTRMWTVCICPCNSQPIGAS
ncbi:hypothetical protein TcCL_NonESM10071 [Trypanosoma cruzi]|nr:hypothetical protein TcCL_NonESM10071 [Trypanosoma cruzi]